MSGVTGYASKAAEQACRIAGVLTARADPSAPEVTGETMADAITPRGLPPGREAARLVDRHGFGRGREGQALRQWLLTRREYPEVLPRDVLRLAPIRALRESPAAKAAIGMLVKYGWLVDPPEGAEMRASTGRKPIGS